MHFNNRNYGKTDYLIKTPFKQTWDDSPIIPPPPGSEIMITETGSLKMITESGQYMITE